MKIVNVGINYRHPESFRIDRPFGSGDYILLLFKTEAFVNISGVYEIIQPNSVLVYKKGTPQNYGALSGEYCNDWMHFELSDEEEREFEELKIPFDKVFAASNAPIITEYIKNIFVERYSENAHREESLSLYFRLILLKLSEAASSERVTVARPYYERLLRLKNEIYDYPEKTRTLDGISRELSLSRSYIQHLYKDYFGVSLTEDVKRARMEYAKHLLSGTKMSVSDIALASGYNSDVHFMRLFKTYSGMSPSEFRRKTMVDDNEVVLSKNGNPFCL